MIREHDASCGLKLPPHSIEAEQALLGALLLDNSAWEKVADAVSTEDFYRDDHRRIFRHIARFMRENKPADIVTIYEAIERSNETEQAGGFGYLAEIANNAISSARVRAYADIVRDKALRRRLITVSDSISESAWGISDARSAIDNAQSALMALADTGSPADPLPIASILGPLVQTIQDRYDKDGSDVVGLPTGLHDLDHLTTGLQEGDMVVIAGRPSMGKSALALNIAEHTALSGKTALVFSLEMSKEQLGLRTLASIGGIPLNALRTGKLNDKAGDWDRITEAMRRLYEVPLIIDESVGLSVAQMAARSRRIARKQDLALIVIDYLQLISGAKDSDNRANELAEISRSIKALAKELRVPVIALSQLSRKVEERGDKRPMMSDLRESGAIEQDADVIMLMYRDDYYNQNSPYQDIAEIIVAKQRMGETGVVRAYFQKSESRFRNADHASLRDIDQRQKSPPKAERKGRSIDD